MPLSFSKVKRNSSFNHVVQVKDRSLSLWSQVSATQGKKCEPHVKRWQFLSVCPFMMDKWLWTREKNEKKKKERKKSKQKISFVRRNAVLTKNDLAKGGPCVTAHHRFNWIWYLHTEVFVWDVQGVDGFDTVERSEWRKRENWRLQRICAAVSWEVFSAESSVSSSRPRHRSSDHCHHHCRRPRRPWTRLIWGQSRRTVHSCVFVQVPFCRTCLQSPCPLSVFPASIPCWSDMLVHQPNVHHTKCNRRQLEEVNGKWSL